MMAIEQVEISGDEQLKAEAVGILSKLGLSLEEFNRIAYHQVVLRRGLPFEVALPDQVVSATTDVQREDCVRIEKTNGNAAASMTAQHLGEMCLAKTDVEAWEAVRDRYVSLNDARTSENDQSMMSRFERNYFKYFDLNRWMTYHARHAIQLGLHEDRGVKSLVDIGCGAGIFPFVGRCLGHDTRGFDIESDMYRDMAAVLDVPYDVVRVGAFKPLPEHYREVDVFTAIATKFDRQDFADRNAGSWGVDEWKYLLADLASRMTPSGSFYLKPNRHDAEALFERPEVEEFLTGLAGQVTPTLEFIFYKDALDQIAA